MGSSGASPWRAQRHPQPAEIGASGVVRLAPSPLAAGPQRRRVAPRGSAYRQGKKPADPYPTASRHAARPSRPSGALCYLTRTREGGVREAALLAAFWEVPWEAVRHACRLSSRQWAPCPRGEDLASRVRRRDGHGDDGGGQERRPELHGEAVGAAVQSLAAALPGAPLQGLRRLARVSRRGANSGLTACRARETISRGIRDDLPTNVWTLLDEPPIGGDRRPDAFCARRRGTRGGPWASRSRSRSWSWP